MVFQILGRIPDDAAAVEDIVRSDRGAAEQVSMRAHPAVWAQGDVSFDHDVWSDLNGGIQFGSGINNRSRMNHWS